MVKVNPPSHPTYKPATRYNFIYLVGIICTRVHTPQCQLLLSKWFQVLNTAVSVYEFVLCLYTLHFTGVLMQLSGSFQSSLNLSVLNFYRWRLDDAKQSFGGRHHSAILHKSCLLHCYIQLHDFWSASPEQATGIFLFFVTFFLYFFIFLLFFCIFLFNFFCSSLSEDFLSSTRWFMSWTKRLIVCQL